MAIITLFSDDYKETQYQMLTYEGKDPSAGAGLDDFIKFLRGALKTITPVDAQILLEPAFPDYIINGDITQLPNPVITWTVDSMSPANLNGKPKKNAESGVREVVPRLRATPEIDGVTYEVRGQTMQAWIRFDVWTTKASEAERVTDWFRRYFMEHYAPKSGVSVHWFSERLTDKQVSQINNKLHVRSLMYFVQLEETTAVRMDKIQSITVQLEQVNELS